MPLLTREELVILIAKAQGGDIAARNEVVTCNIGLVPPVARCFLNRGMELGDLIGEGNLGLIRAVGEFDPRFGTSFSTYATYWIKEAIHRALRNTASLIRVPLHMVTLLVNRARDALTTANGHKPGFDEVAAGMGLSSIQQELVAKALRARICKPHRESPRSWQSDIERSDSFDAPDGAPSAGSAIETAEDRAAMRQRLAVLDDRERTVMGWRYGIDSQELLLQREIGQRLGVCKERVRQIEDRAIRKMQRAVPIAPLNTRKSHA